jgi:hypothetical protein
MDDIKFIENGLEYAQKVMKFFFFAIDKYCDHKNIMLLYNIWANCISTP